MPTPSVVVLRTMSPQEIVDHIHEEEPDLSPILDWLRRGFKVGMYQNEAMDSAQYGRITGLKVGQGCTFQSAPPRFPDGTPLGPGWKYVFACEIDPDLVVVPR